MAGASRRHRSLRDLAVVAVDDRPIHLSIPIKGFARDPNPYGTNAECKDPKARMGNKWGTSSFRFSIDGDVFSKIGTKFRRRLRMPTESTVASRYPACFCGTIRVLQVGEIVCNPKGPHVSQEHERPCVVGMMNVGSSTALAVGVVGMR